MTISSATAKSQHDGNDSSTVFAVGFWHILDEDVQVVLTDSSGVETVQTITTHYTLSGAGNPAGGNVTMVAAPATGEVLTITRNVTLDQSVDYVTGDNFRSETHEQALDRLTMQVQELQEKIDRCVKAPVSEDIGVPFTSEFPARANRFDSLLGFDATGMIELSGLGVIIGANTITFNNGEAWFKIVGSASAKTVELYAGYSLASLTLFSTISIP